MSVKGAMTPRSMDLEPLKTPPSTPRAASRAPHTPRAAHSDPSPEIPRTVRLDPSPEIMMYRQTLLESPVSQGINGRPPYLTLPYLMGQDKVKAGLKWLAAPARM